MFIIQKNHPAECDQYSSVKPGLDQLLGMSPPEGQTSDVRVQAENGLVCLNIRLNGHEEVWGSYGLSVVVRTEITAES